MMRLFLTLILTFGFATFTTAQAPPPLFLNEIQIPPLVVYNSQGNYDLDAIQTTHNFNPHDPNDHLNDVITFVY